MRKFLLELGHFRRSEDGATLVEYGIAIVLAVIVGTGALITLAGQVSTNMGEAETAMQDRGPAN